MRRIALRHDVARTALASSALRGNTQLKLDVVETHASTRVTSYLTVGNAVTNADDHDGSGFWLAVDDAADYKCEYIAFAMHCCLAGQSARRAISNLSPEPDEVVVVGGEADGLI
jgi:hypothetical protein